MLEPYGEERADLRAGSIVAMVHNVNVLRGTKLSAFDCALKFLPPPKQRLTAALTTEQARAEFDAFKAFKKEGKRPVI